MTYFEFVNLWEKGYSKKFIIEQEAKHLKNNYQVGRRQKGIRQIKEEAQKNIEDFMLKFWRDNS